jgi:ubiquinone/menaquinone biosynthesis C-methylase UbiE
MVEKHICPVEKAWGLDNFLRRWLHNPQKILGTYVKEGMVVLDVGCGPGLFARAMATMVGEQGKVIAADLQEGMLQRLHNSIKGMNIRKRITLHRCEEQKIGVTEKVDFVLAFYMVHEVPNQAAFFKEVKSLLKPRGRVFVIEPKYHVSKKAFAGTMRLAAEAGLKPVKEERVFLSRAMILEH